MLFTVDKRRGRFSESAEVGSHAVGTHVKALAVLPEDDEGAWSKSVIATSRPDHAQQMRWTDRLRTD
jgi:hypothetical protein